MSAVISPCRRYRYRLDRDVDPLLSDRIACFIMLNPSIADAEKDDPTIRRCKDFARRWGCGRLAVVNLFAFRATKPIRLFEEGAPRGPDNDAYIVDAAKEAQGSGGIVLAAWGVHGRRFNRDLAVHAMLISHGVSLSCIGFTERGDPRHPLFVRQTVVPAPLDGARFR